MQPLYCKGISDNDVLIEANNVSYLRMKVVTRLTSPFLLRGEVYFILKRRNEMIQPKEQLRIILKGVHQVVGEDDLLDKLEKAYQTQTPLTVKLGLDPSAPDIHIGHCVVLRKMKQLQDLGHCVVIVIGDFTGKIGDPTGKAKGRVALTDEQVMHNAKTYCNQIFKVLDPQKTKVLFNSEWLSKLQFEDVIRLASTTTVARMLERDDFQSRYQSRTPIGIHEFFYPLMQAYDSIHLKADIELGGTDQTFNILMGRTLQKHMNQAQQAALFMPILEGLDGIEKMSKSLGNYIGVEEAPEVMFKKVMEIPDTLILKYFELATDVHPDDILQIEHALAAGVNPRDIKYRLAQTITALYHSPDGLRAAMHFYDEAFSKKAIPEKMPELALLHDQATLSDMTNALRDSHFFKSKSEWLRLIRQGGVQLNGQKIDESSLDKPIERQDVLKIGKKVFVRFV